jgi:hypothetical protein
MSGIAARATLFGEANFIHGPCSIIRTRLFGFCMCRNAKCSLKSYLYDSCCTRLQSFYCLGDALYSYAARQIS